MSKQFHDYESTFCDYQRKCRERRIPCFKFNDVYKIEMTAAAQQGNRASVMRMISEVAWHKERRPFFNVYPSVRDKLEQFDSNVELCDINLPYWSLEIRTHDFSILAGDVPLIDASEFSRIADVTPKPDTFRSHFSVTIDLPDGTFQEMAIAKATKLNDIFSMPFEREKSTWNTVNDGHGPTTWMKIFRLVIGVCLLARDQSIVTPVILNKDRRDNMTPAEIARYAEKAVSRTGRVGFDVGRDMERNKASMHYRNGCFAKYYVGPGHDLYPPTAGERTVPVIKWRSGAVVNKDRLAVPTGFRDQPASV